VKRKVVVGADPDPSKFVKPELSPKLEDRNARRMLQRRKRSAYVAEGYFICRRLRYNSQYLGVPDGSSAITSLDVSPDGVVYAATSGETVHVFAFNPKAPFDTVAPLAALEGETDCRRSIVWEKEGSAICGTRATGARPDDWEGGGLYRITGHPYYFDAVQEWPRGMGQTEKLGVPVPGEGIAALVIDRLRNRLYGLSDKTSRFFLVDLASGNVDLRDEVDPLWHHSENLMIDSHGRVFGTAVGNRLVRFDPESDRLEMLEQTVPSFPGRALYSRIDSWVWEPVARVFYVGDREDGFLYTLDPETLETCLLGKPTDRLRIRALSASKDGRVFGIAGRAGDVCQMFVYEPETRQLRNLGIPLAAIEERHYGFEFDSAVAGPQGQIYFGESERSSRLFIYFPAWPSPPAQDDDA